MPLCAASLRWSAFVSMYMMCKFLHFLFLHFHTSGALHSDVTLLWFFASVAATLPYQKQDEVLWLLHNTHTLLSRRGETCLVELKDALREHEV